MAWKFFLNLMSVFLNRYKRNLWHWKTLFWFLSYYLLRSWNFNNISKQHWLSSLEDFILSVKFLPKLLMICTCIPNEFLKVRLLHKLYPLENYSCISSKVLVIHWASVLMKWISLLSYTKSCVTSNFLTFSKITNVTLSKWKCLGDIIL